MRKDPNSAMACVQTSVVEQLWLIWAIGCDYDGSESAEELRGLVDELVSIATEARQMLYEGEILPAAGEMWMSAKPSREELIEMLDKIQDNVADNRKCLLEGEKANDH